jgi:hypothetical protein
VAGDSVADMALAVGVVGTPLLEVRGVPSAGGSAFGGFRGGFERPGP